MPGRRAPRTLSPAPVRQRPGPVTRDLSGEGLGGEQVEGRRAVLELLSARRRDVFEVLVATGQKKTSLEEIARRALSLRIPLRYVEPGHLAALARTEAPQGVVARAAPMPEVPLAELARAVPGMAPPFLVVLDKVTDPQNLGAILRSALCAGATGAVLPERRGAHLGPAALKAAAGAAEHLPIALVPGTATALRTLSAAGVWTVGLSPEGRRDVYDIEVLDAPCALVFGSEGAGLSRLVAERCEVLARIPQHGPVASLNVSAAAAVACFAVARARQRPVGAADGPL